jgi:chromate transporter
VTAVTGSEIAVLFVGCGLLMILLEAPPRVLDVRRAFRRPRDPDADAGAVASWLVLGASGGLLASLCLFFVITGATVFGSGLAILPVLRSGIVQQHHWLTNKQLLDGLSVGLMTPGPVVIAATFLGYQIGGLAGAAVATLGIFAPIYLGVIVPGPWFIRHRNNRQIKAFVRGATAAAAGAIAGAVIVLGRQTITDWRSALITIAALAALVRFRVKEPLLVLAGAGIGLAFLR